MSCCLCRTVFLHLVVGVGGGTESTHKRSLKFVSHLLLFGSLSLVVCYELVLCLFLIRSQFAMSNLDDLIRQIVQRMCGHLRLYVFLQFNDGKSSQFAIMYISCSQMYNIAFSLQFNQSKTYGHDQSALNASTI